MPRGDVTDFVVEVLEGPLTGARLTLKDRSLPYRASAGGSISYGQSQRSKLTWYPGNPVASQQIVGPTLDPTTINGVWKDRYLGDDASIDLVEAFQEICASGVQVRVSWSTIVRRGIVKRVFFQPGVPTGGLGDIAWQVTFEWNQAGVPPRRKVGAGEGDLRDGLVSGASALGQLTTAIEDVIELGNTFLGLLKTGYQAIRGDLEDVVEEVEKPIESLLGAAARIGDEPNLPARFLLETSAAIGSAQVSSGLAAETTAGISAGALVDADDLASQLSAHLVRVEVLDRAFEALETLHVQRSRIEEIARPPSYARVPALVGADLRLFAIQYYGRADLWSRIAEANGIEGSKVPVDLNELVIPLALPDSLDRSIG